MSTNIAPHRVEFETLLDQVVCKLKEDSLVKKDWFLRCNSLQFEEATKDMLDSCSKGTPFENTIELVSGQHFPDIVARGYYGVEVKTTKSNQWKSTGSSVAEGTRVKGVERIFMLFGKMCDPVDFMCKPYEDCLSGVVVTHSPRYLIDMNIEQGETFFDKIAIPYDDLRKQDEPIKTILDYYKKNLKPGQTTWWADAGQSKSTNVIVRLWNSIDMPEKQRIKTKALLLFPEILGTMQAKYNRMNLWLVTIEGVVVPNVRDMFTAGGQKLIVFNGRSYTVPKIIFTLYDNVPGIIESMNSCDRDELIEYWGVALNNRNLLDTWASLIGQSAITLTDFPVEEYILSHR